MLAICCEKGLYRCVYFLHHLLFINAYASPINRPMDVFRERKKAMPHETAALPFCMIYYTGIRFGPFFTIMSLPAEIS